MTDAAGTTTDAGEGTTHAEGSQVETKTTEWYESELSKVRSEAAKHRTAKKEAVEATKTELTNEFTAKLTAAEDAHSATKGELSKTQRELSKLRAALSVDSVPKSAVVEFASLLQGDSEEEIKAHAESVSKLFGSANSSRTPAIDPSPNGKGNAMPLNGDPVEQALKSALGIQ